MKRQVCVSSAASIIQFEHFGGGGGEHTVWEICLPSIMLACLLDVKKVVSSFSTVQKT